MENALAMLFMLQVSVQRNVDRITYACTKEELNDDIKTMPEEERERYIAKYKGWVQILFNKHSRIMSAMITGPARFPSRRNEKMNNYYDNAVNEFRAWREKVLKSIARRVGDKTGIRKRRKWMRVKDDR